MAGSRAQTRVWHTAGWRTLPEDEEPGVPWPGEVTGPAQEVRSVPRGRGLAKAWAWMRVVPAASLSRPCLAACRAFSSGPASGVTVSEQLYTPAN